MGWGRDMHTRDHEVGRRRLRRGPGIPVHECMGGVVRDDLGALPRKERTPELASVPETRV